MEKKNEKPIIYFIKLNKVRSIFNRYLPNEPTILRVKSKQKTLEEFKKIIKMTEILHQKNSQLYFIYLPDYIRYAQEYNDSNYLANYLAVKKLLKNWIFHLLIFIVNYLKKNHSTRTLSF